jgi:peptide subunit release factor 1 (eRF1)
MTRLLVTCSHCNLEFAVRDNGHADPSKTIWCPFCGSQELHPVEAMDEQTVEPQEAA